VTVEQKAHKRLRALYASHAYSMIESREKAKIRPPSSAWVGNTTVRRMLGVWDRMPQVIFLPILALTRRA